VVAGIVIVALEVALAAFFRLTLTQMFAMDMP